MDASDIQQRAGGAVLLVIPCLNEEEHIEKVVCSLLKDTDSIPLTLVVADGGSTDATRAVVARIAAADTRVRLTDNPARIQSAAINAAVDAYGDDAAVLIRADAHAEYPDGYCAKLLAVRARTGADSVVVTMDTRGHGCFQRAAAAAQNSLLGNGGSSHRSATRGRWVDHGHHALMTMAAFRAVDGYDETFSHNEDAELDARLRESGFRIYLTGEAPVIYYPRRTPGALFLQYFKIGRGRARNFLKHRSSTKPRHLVLVAIAPAVCLLVLSPWLPIAALPALGWAGVCIGYGVVLAIRSRDRCVAAAGIAAMATQAGWSFGFVTEICANLMQAGLAKIGRSDPRPRTAGDSGGVKS